LERGTFERAWEFGGLLPFPLQSPEWAPRKEKKDVKFVTVWAS